MEAKFVALSAFVQEGIWLRRFLEHLINKGDAIELVVISCDSHPTIVKPEKIQFL